MTAKQVEVAIWKLWGFVRDNQNNLDSEHCCRMIQEVVNGVVASVNKRAEDLAVELDEVRQELRDSKKEIKRLASELETSCETIARLEPKAAEDKDKDEPPKNDDADHLPKLVELAASDAIRNFITHGKAVSEQDCYPSLCLRGNKWRYHRRVAGNEWADDPDPMNAARKAHNL